MSFDDALIQRELFIRTFFPTSPPDRVANQFVAAMREISFPAGTEIYREGDPSDQLFFIINGTVRLETTGKEPWVFDDESMIGILDASMQRPYSRTATAETNVNAIVMDNQDYIEILEDNFEFSKNIMIGSLRTLHTRSMTLPPEVVFPATEAQQEAILVERILQTGRKLNQVERLMILHSSRYLQSAPVQPLVTLSGFAREEHFKAGEKVFAVGEPNDAIHIVAHGEILLAREEPPIEAIFGPGGMVGASAALATSVHEYDAVAQTDATTICVRKEDLYDVMEDHFGLALAMFAFVGKEHSRFQEEMANVEASTRDLVPATSS